MLTWVISLLGSRAAIYAALIAASAIGTYFYGDWMYGLGRDKERAVQLLEIERYRDAQATLQKQLQEAKRKREVVYRDRLRTIREVVDSCADTNIPDDVARVLSEDYPR